MSQTGNPASERPVTLPEPPIAHYERVAIPKNPDGSPRLWVTPEDFGAMADSGQCASDAFDKLAAAMLQGVAVVIPARRYYLSRTWVLPYAKGGRVMGMGGMKHEETEPGGPIDGASSVLYWIGEEGGTMVTMTGSNLVWDSVGLNGQNTAGTGLFIVKPHEAKGIGTGKALFRALSVVGCETGIRLGAGGNNVDNLVWDYTYIHECKTGLLLDATMAMGHIFTYLQFRKVETGIWVRRGGDLIVHGGLNVGTKTFLKVGDADGTAPGRNNGMILIEGFKTDAQNVDLTWLDVATPADCSITLTNCHQAWTRDGLRYPRKWILRGATRLTLRDCVNVFGIDSFVLLPHEGERPEVYEFDPATGQTAITNRPRLPNVLLDRCRVDFGAGPADWIESSKGHHRFRVRDCYRGTGAPIADVD